MNKIKPKPRTVIRNSRKRINGSQKKINLVDKNITKNNHKVTKIKIYSDQLLYSPFDFESYTKQLAREGFTLSKSPLDADIIASSYTKNLKKYLQSGKQLLLWTHEPYHDWTDRSQVVINGKKIHVMTVYTGDVFIDNYRYFYFKKQLTPLTMENFPDFTDQRRLVAALSTYFPESHYTNNKYTTLPERFAIIRWGHAHQRLKVWGRGWGRMAEGESRKDRVRAKVDILKNFHFNLAIENASAKYYVTEKIWESISNYCLPIYYGGRQSTIYQDFPKDSFLDYAQFKNPEQLFKYIQEMSIDEYRLRMNRCIEVFNKLVDMNQKQEKLGQSRFRSCPKNKNLETVDYLQVYQPFLNKLKKLA